MKKIAFIFYFIGSLQILMAQTTFKFDSESYDFGELFEDDLAVHIFNITNTGTTPLIISEVRPSCGCTTPEWSREPILAGKTGTIKATYGTHGRIGTFNKSIAISTNGTPANTTIYIRGAVNAKLETKFSESEIKLSPKLIFEKSNFNFGKIESGAKISVRILVSNLGRSDLKITKISAACNCVSYASKQDYIKSGEKSLIEIVYSPSGQGTQTDIMYIKSNDLLKPSQKIELSSEIVETLQPSLLKVNNSNSMFK